MKSLKNTDGLKAFAKNRERTTIKKVREAIAQLKRSKATITFIGLSKLTGVSRTTLYRNQKVRQIIQIEKGILNKHQTEIRISQRRHELDIKNQKISELYDRIKELKQQKDDLIIQLIEMDNLKKRNENLKKTIEKYQSQSHLR